MTELLPLLYGMADLLSAKLGPLLLGFGAFGGLPLAQCTALLYALRLKNGGAR